MGNAAYVCEEGNGMKMCGWLCVCVGFASSLLFGVAAVVSRERTKDFYFMTTKNDVWSLSEEFVAHVAETFNADIFIESGTGLGGTTASAAKYFKEVYSIELEESLYARACERFKDVSHVHLLHGDSGKILPSLLASLKDKKILFWLDGHYSGKGAGSEISTTPIMQELRAIADAGITNAVILVDDICCFSPPVADPPLVAQGYPSVQQLKEEIIVINKEYEFYIYGDIALACVPSEHITCSPFVKAMTTSRLWSSADGANYEDILAAEHAIATKATAQEKAALKDLMIEHVGREWSVYPFLWHGLARLGDKGHDAMAFIFFAIDGGYKDIRLYWYFNNALKQAPDQMKDLPELVARHDPLLIGLKKYVDEKVPELFKK